MLVLDEHTAALDPKSSETLMEITDKIVKEKNLTTLMVTHNLRFAVEYGSRMVMMHEGKCVLDINGEEKKNAKVDELLKSRELTAGILLWKVNFLQSFQE